MKTNKCTCEGASCPDNSVKARKQAIRAKHTSEGQANVSEPTPTPWKVEGRALFPENPLYGKIADVYEYVSGEENAVANANFIVRAVNSHEALLEAAKDALCELDPDCKYDGSNYNGEPSDKGNSRIQTILALYRIIEQADGK